MNSHAEHTDSDPRCLTAAEKHQIAFLNTHIYPYQQSYQRGVLRPQKLMSSTSQTLL